MESRSKSGLPPWGSLPSSASSLIRDVPVMLAGLALFYAFLSLARYWATPAGTQAAIDLHPSALPKYAFFSVARIVIAYFVSLIFTLVYAYIAAHNRTAERFMIPLLDTLQSIPVLSFLPGVMVAMVSLFPNHQLGVELGSILLIFTGQVWNMAFSVYSSMKNVPVEMLEAAQVYGLSRWQKFVQLELPYSAIGLIWNSMMSVAGAWFFLMACEMFVLGNRDLRLPGLGSYLQSASNKGDLGAIIWGLSAMIAVIVLMDQCIWRPIIAWSEKFKFEQVEASQAPGSPILDLIYRSQLLRRARRSLIEPAREALALRLARKRGAEPENPNLVTWNDWLWRVTSVAALIGLGWAVFEMGSMLLELSRPDLADIFRGAGATFLRVEASLVLAVLWTVPVGVYIGLRPKLSAVAQPIAQIAASVPATALFPILLMFLIQAGGGLGVGSILLMLLGTQWYVLFNVIAGATSIPTDLKEVCDIFQLHKWERWRTLFLPGIFPFLVTGLITASGGAWNASIVAEYVRFNGKTITTTGLGAVISRATDAGNFALLLGATIVMAAMVVTINRLLWRRLYVLAATKYKLET